MNMNARDNWRRRDADKSGRKAFTSRICRTWFPRYSNAPEDVFDRLPGKGDVRRALAAELGQPANEIGDKELRSIGEDGVKETITAVECSTRTIRQREGS